MKQLKPPFFALIIFAIASLGARPAKSGNLLHNLPWFLQDLVVATTLSQTTYQAWRRADMLQIEMKLRENANPDTIWLEQLPDDTTAAKAQCSQFRTQTYAQWLDGSSVSAPQWREAWHGVAVRADYKTRLSNWSQVKSINLIAAVKSPGIPASAFVNDKTGALRPVFFDTAALFKAAGFDRMRGVVGQLSMHLKEQKSCDGYELYTWQFSR